MTIALAPPEVRSSNEFTPLSLKQATLHQGVHESDAEVLQLHLEASEEPSVPLRSRDSDLLAAKID